MTARSVEAVRLNCRASEESSIHPQHVWNGYGRAGPWSLAEGSSPPQRHFLLTLAGGGETKAAGWPLAEDPFC